MDLALEASLRAGLAYMVATGGNDISLASARQRIAIYNPADSKRNIIISKMIAENNAPAMSFANLVINPAQTLGGSVITPTNLNLDTTKQLTSATTVKTDTTNTPLTGDSVTTFGVPGNARTVFDDIPLLVPPGVSVGFDVKYLNLLGLIKAEVIIIMREEKIA